MKKSELLSAYREYECEMRESDRIDRIIESREKEQGEFTLPEDFDPHLNAVEKLMVSRRCHALEKELGRRGFDVVLDRGIPLKVKLRYASHIAFVTEGIEMSGNQRIVFNGCGGWCEECFQSPWCKTREEIEEEMEEEGESVTGNLK